MPHLSESRAAARLLVSMYEMQ